MHHQGRSSSQVYKQDDRRMPNFNWHTNQPYPFPRAPPPRPLPPRPPNPPPHIRYPYQNKHIQSEASQQSQYNIEQEMRYRPPTVTAMTATSSQNETPSEQLDFRPGSSQPQFVSNPMSISQTYKGYNSTLPPSGHAMPHGVPQVDHTRSQSSLHQSQPMNEILDTSYHTTGHHNQNTAMFLQSKSRGQNERLPASFSNVRHSMVPPQPLQGLPPPFLPPGPIPPIFQQQPKTAQGQHDVHLPLPQENNVSSKQLNSHAYENSAVVRGFTAGSDQHVSAFAGSDQRQMSANQDIASAQGNTQIFLTPKQIVDKQNPDYFWMKNWLHHKGYTTNQEKGSSLHCKIAMPEAKSLLRGTFKLVEELKQVIKELSQGLDESLKKEKLQKAEGIKANLEEMKKVLGSEQAQATLKQKIEKRRKTRERKKRKRKLQFEAAQAEEAARKKEHEEIDKWQEGIQNKIQEAKREEELKAITDKTLSEVTRKMTDINKSLQILDGLRKLRNVRKDSMQRKGLYAPAESEKMFEQRINLQTETLLKQKQTYEAEKRLLQVMLETEQEECKEYEAEELLRIKEDKERKLGKTIREHLFGKGGSPEPGDPLYTFYQYYNAAESSFEHLCAIRQEWDCYLVPENSSQGSRVPSTWVVPSTPSNEAWATALKS